MAVRNQAKAIVIGLVGAGMLVGATSAVATQDRPTERASSATTPETPELGPGPGDQAPPPIQVDPRTNARGETYGSAGAADPPEAEAQLDLIAAVATNGRSGYVRATEMDAADPPPKSPAEAAARQPRSYTLNVYLADGVTVIGEFRVVGGTESRSWR